MLSCGLVLCLVSLGLVLCLVSLSRLARVLLLMTAKACSATLLERRGVPEVPEVPVSAPLGRG